MFWLKELMDHNPFIIILQMLKLLLNKATPKLAKTSYKSSNAPFTLTNTILPLQQDPFQISWTKIPLKQVNITTKSFIDQPLYL